MTSPTPTVATDVDVESDLLEFPLFEVNDAEAGFGCSIGRYVGAGYEDGKVIGSGLRRKLRREAEVAGDLFFSGGKLADHGLRVREELDATTVHRALSALLKSFQPSHEGKMGTVALAIHHWCEEIPIANAESVS